MPDRDITADRVDRILTEGARRAYLGEEPEVSCIECGEAVDPERAFSAVDPATGRRGYVCAPCNFDPIHDQ